MVHLKKIIKFLDKYLAIDSVKDASWNGLQIEGNPEVGKIALAVDAHFGTFQKAVDLKADLLVVHHGHFWKESNPSLRDWNKERIELLLKNGISLYAAHLPLDKHKKIGHNAKLLELVGAKIKEPFGKYHGEYISWLGEIGKPAAIEKIKATIDKKLGIKSKLLAFGPDMIKRVAVCSGGGEYDDFFEALEKKADLYITGDSIDIYAVARDAKMNVIFAGHNATETLGLRALEKVLKKKFKIEAAFIDFPTGL